MRKRNVLHNGERRQCTQVTQSYRVASYLTESTVTGISNQVSEGRGFHPLYVFVLRALCLLHLKINLVLVIKVNGTAQHIP